MIPETMKAVVLTGPVREACIARIRGHSGRPGKSPGEEISAIHYEPEVCTFLPPGARMPGASGRREYRYWPIYKEMIRLRRLCLFQRKNSWMEKTGAALSCQRIPGRNQGDRHCI